MPCVDHSPRNRRAELVDHLTAHQQRLVAVIVIGLQRAVGERSVVKEIRTLNRAHATAEVAVLDLTDRRV
jgi:hypothetical protein